MVGTAITKAFKEIGHSVYVYDIKIPESNLEGTLSSDVIYICVPTKKLENGSCDTSIVEEIVEKLSKYDYKGRPIELINYGISNNICSLYDIGLPIYKEKNLNQAFGW